MTWHFLMKGKDAVKIMCTSGGQKEIQWERGNFYKKIISSGKINEKNQTDFRKRHYDLLLIQLNLSLKSGKGRSGLLFLQRNMCKTCRTIRKLNHEKNIFSDNIHVSMWVFLYALRQTIVFVSQFCITDQASNMSQRHFFLKNLLKLISSQW